MLWKRLQSDLRSPFWIYAKAVIFLCIVFLAGMLIFVETGSFRVLGLVAIAIWASCRLYYFAFYVIEKYLDPRFKFASLTGLVFYLLGSRKPSGSGDLEKGDPEE